QQMAVMMGGMLLAGVMVISMLPKDIGFDDALHVAGKMGKLNVVNFDFNLNDRYNFWSGITAALFLFMSYFGTDQSQVQRYLSGKSVTESRLGLMMNGLLKVPMQFIILFIGVMVFVFYQFVQPPIFFNKVEKQKTEQSVYSAEFKAIENQYTEVFNQKKQEIKKMVNAVNAENNAAVLEAKSSVLALQDETNRLRDEAKKVIKKASPTAETNDKDYIFMTYVMDFLPIGMVGLLFAVMFSAAMSSTSSELNALASTTTIDLYQRSINKNATEMHYLKSSKWFTLLWGVLAIVFATYASLFENLIQAVNLLGSLFYGTILGIFIVAFYVKFIKGNAVFYGAILAELCVVYIHYLNENAIAPSFLTMGFLWYNIVGCGLVVLFGLLLQLGFGKKKNNH
ncbi:MAG: sodium:solute symporter, partial [Flavobacteriales bacterium]|nr:sodium:solute symporter [Flavobacteriales bacterium]